MSKPKIITVLGARPQFIKAAILSRNIKDIVQEHIIHTGQHFDHNMSQIFFDTLEIPQPKWHLDCAALSHGMMTAKMLTGIEAILLEQQPKAILVYGDTNSTLAAALAASKLAIPIWHVESGVRSFNKKMPEEINRTITDRIADVHFAPSLSACKNLLNEGVSPLSIHEVGDVMYDLYLASKDKEKPIELSAENNFLLVTLHRAENFSTENELQLILKGLNVIAEEFSIIWPMHPRVKKIFQQKSRNLNSNIFIVDPFDYYETLYVLHKCRGVLTDSGGLQKEAFYASKPCIIVREETEWVELLASGWNMLASSKDLHKNSEHIFNFLKANFSKKEKKNFYGEGKACLKIKEIMSDILKL